ncbi:MAG TPA: TIGR03619 family F420-dependent LLM class oxidoreductase [Acidimicrobiales bacterium]|nr:TIGR03619 family F420-dependent LLM class oxidoreductase [Acidimicrobiales bacterium]
MKYSLSLPVDQVEPVDEFCTATAVMEMAAAAEAAGFAAVHATEHPFPSWVGTDMGGHQALDPLVCMAFVAAATSQLRLHFNAFIVPYRNPFLGAKGLGDLDAMSGGRVIAGLAPGYLAGEFDALGVRLEDRAELLDEAIPAMKAAWTGEAVHLESSRWVARGNVMLPRPHQRPHPPIWIGGNSRAAIRRVVHHAQGWMPFPAKPNEATAVRTASITSIDDLRVRIDALRAEADAIGRTEPIDICMTPFTHQHHPRGQENYDPPVLRDEAEQLAELGVTWLSVKLRSPDRGVFLDYIERFGKEVINA